MLFYSVHDGAVMNAWKYNLQLANSMLQMMGDPSGEFTRACGMELTHPGPQEKGLYGRCKRFAMHVVNCEVKYVAVSESDEDPAGDKYPESSCADAIIAYLEGDVAIQ